jgi:hypothetical protein
LLELELVSSSVKDVSALRFFFLLHQMLLSEFSRVKGVLQDFAMAVGSAPFDFLPWASRRRRFIVNGLVNFIDVCCLSLYYLVATGSSSRYRSLTIKKQPVAKEVTIDKTPTLSTSAGVSFYKNGAPIFFLAIPCEKFTPAPAASSRPNLGYRSVFNNRQ